MPRFFRINRTLPHGGFIAAAESFAQSVSEDDAAAEVASASIQGTSAAVSTSCSDSSLDWHQQLMDALPMDDVCDDDSDDISLVIKRGPSLAAPTSTSDQSQHTVIPPLDDDDDWYSFLAQHGNVGSSAFSASEDSMPCLLDGGVQRAASGPLFHRSSDESVTSCFAALSGLGSYGCDPPSDFVTSSISSGTNSVTPKRCRVDSCGADITADQSYRKRYRLCKSCMGQASILIDGKEMRFCQQCSNLHPVEAFEGAKRSCRSKLVKHKLRGRAYRSRKRRCSESDGPASSVATV